MAVKIRLQRKGRKKLPFYYVVVADSRSPRDGKFIERIGSYNPVPKIPLIDINIDKAMHWLDKGAQPTKTVRNLLSREGVLYKKHLYRGVKLGIMTKEQADEKFEAYMQEKAVRDEKIKDKFIDEKNRKIKAIRERESKISDDRAQAIAKKRKEEMEKNMPEDAKVPTPEEVTEEATDTADTAETQEQATSEEPKAE